MTQSAKERVETFLKVFHGESAPSAAVLGEFMAEDAIYWSLVPAAPQLRGTQAIAQGIEKQFGTYRDCRCEIHAICEGEGIVFTERTDHVVLNSDNRTVSARICAVFEMTSDGLISSWREYWDSDEVITQMGVERSALEDDLS